MDNGGADGERGVHSRRPTRGAAARRAPWEATPNSIFWEAASVRPAWACPAGSRVSPRWRRLGRRRKGAEGRKEEDDAQIGAGIGFSRGQMG
jgi:hypothetical protein